LLPGWGVNHRGRQPKSQGGMARGGGNHGDGEKFADEKKKKKRKESASRGRFVLPFCRQKKFRAERGPPEKQLNE